MEKWIRARYQPNLPLDGDRRVTASRLHIALSRQAAQEGMVLLKNDGDLLPLAPGTRVALFGKGSFDYVKGGGSRGGGQGEQYLCLVGSRGQHPPQSSVRPEF